METNANQSQSDAELFLKLMPLIPLQIMAWLQGKALRPFFSEISGLSSSRLRKGRNWEFRDSTTKNITKAAMQWSIDKAIANGWSQDDLSKLREGEPSTLAGKTRPFADFIHTLQTPDWIALPLSISFANEVDVMLNSLRIAYEDRDLDSFKHLLLNCNWGQDVSNPAATEIEEINARKALHASSTWEETLTLAKQCFQNILLLLIAAIDVEYGSVYFGRFEARPLLLLVTPITAVDVDLNHLDKLPKRNWLHKPYRRLLEFCYAIAFWAKHKQWPDKPIGRKDLGQILGVNDQSIGNLFDGTRKLTAKTFNVFWDRLCLDVANMEPFPCPLFLFIAANVCQNTMITQHPNQKLKSVTLIDRDHYTRFWTWHRQRWTSDPLKHNESWPNWLST